MAGRRRTSAAGGDDFRFLSERYLKGFRIFLDPRGFRFLYCIFVVQKVFVSLILILDPKGFRIGG